MNLNSSLKEPSLLVKEALFSATALLNEGKSPTEALQKTAEEFSLNPNFVQRVGEAMNVALHFRHFKTASDKSTDFPVADIQGVIRGTFGKEDPTELQKKSEWFRGTSTAEVSPDFYRVLTSVKSQEAYKQIKAAEATDGDRNYSLKLNSLLDKGQKYVEKLAKDLEHWQTEVLEAEREMTQALSKTADEFSKDPLSRPSFAEFEHQVLHRNGEKTAEYVGLVHKLVKTGEARGSLKADNWNYQVCPATRQFESFMAKLAKYKELRSKVAEAEHNLVFERESLLKARHKLGKLAADKKKDKGFMAEILNHEAPHKNEHGELEYENEDYAFAEYARSKGGLGVVSKKEWEAAGKPHLKKKKKTASVDPVIEKLALNHQAPLGMYALLAGTPGQAINQGLGEIGAIRGYAAEAFKKETKDRPLGTSALDNMERKMLLQELLLTDPILKKAPAKDVIAKYEQLMRVAPNISREKELVRAVLREMIQTSSFSPHSSNMLTEADMNLMKQKLTQLGKLKPKIN